MNLIIEDGFTYFADLPPNVIYDAVAIDVAWMSNMNATHLFSKEMYENIARHMTDRAVLFYAAKAAAPDLVSMLPEQSAWVTTWVNRDSRDAPVNRLDDLAMNRHKFTLLGDSTFERLREKYAQLREMLSKR